MQFCEAASATHVPQFPTVVNDNQRRNLPGAAACVHLAGFYHDLECAGLTTCLHICCEIRQSVTEDQQLCDLWIARDLSNDQLDRLLTLMANASIANVPHWALNLVWLLEHSCENAPWGGCFVNGKPRKNDVLPIGSDREDEVVEREHNSAPCDHEEGCASVGVSVGELVGGTTVTQPRSRTGGSYRGGSPEQQRRKFQEQAGFLSLPFS